LIQIYVNRFSDQFIKRMQIDNKKIKNREEEIKNTDLSWFTLPQGLRLVLCKLAKISTKKIARSVYNPCSQQLITALRNTHTSLNPLASVKSVHKSTAPKHLQPTSNHCSPHHSHSTEPLSRCETSAETHCTNSITNPVIENSKQITE